MSIKYLAFVFNKTHVTSRRYINGIHNGPMEYLLCKINLGYYEQTTPNDH